MTDTRQELIEMANEWLRHLGLPERTRPHTAAVIDAILQSDDYVLLRKVRDGDLVSDVSVLQATHVLELTVEERGNGCFIEVEAMEL